MNIIFYLLYTFNAELHCTLRYTIRIPCSAGQLASLPRLISLFREKEPGHKATGQPGETSNEPGYKATGQPKEPGHEGTGQPGEMNIQVSNSHCCVPLPQMLLHIVCMHF